MRLTLLLVTAMFAVPSCLATPTAAPPATPTATPTAMTPTAAFVERQQYSQPRLSPDGRHIALNVRIMRGERSIPTMTVYSLPQLALVSTIALPGFEIPLNFHWVSGERLIVEKGIVVGEHERPQSTGEVVAVNLDGSKAEYLYGYQGLKQSSRGERNGNDHGLATIVQVPQARDGHVYLAVHERRSQQSYLYDVNTHNALRKLVAEVALKEARFIMQHDNTPRFAYGHDDDNQPVLLRRDDAGAWKAVAAGDQGADLRPFAFSADDRAFFAMHSAHGEPTTLVREELASGARQTLAADALGAVGVVEASAKSRQPFAVTIDTGIARARYVDPQAPETRMHQDLSAQFPGSYVHFINFSDDGSQLLFEVVSDRDPGSYYLYDTASKQARLLFTNLPQIDIQRMAERRPIQFAARDGLPLNGYLTVPANPDKRKLPMVLLPHGGPFGVRDTWFYERDAQFLASRGYAVLQVNYRGSGGRGLRFVEAGYREWGGKILDDLVDAVTWAGQLPEIDPKRVCVYGASFGAYAAMMLPVRAPAMFQCAVGYSGRYDLPTKYVEPGIKGNARATAFLVKTLGDDPLLLKQQSPTQLAAQITLPVLLVHGDRDQTTSLEQARMMRDALTRAGHPPAWMEVANEGHGFYDSEHRRDFYEHLAAFLEAHIGH